MKDTNNNPNESDALLIPEHRDILASAAIGDRWFVTWSLREAIYAMFEKFSLLSRDVSRLHAMNESLEKSLKKERSQYEKLLGRFEDFTKSHSKLQNAHKGVLKNFEESLDDVYKATSILEDVLARATGNETKAKPVVSREPKRAEADEKLPT